MSSSRSKRQRLIGLLYWAVWGWCALAVALCAAAATWIGWEQVVLLTLVGLPVMAVAGLWSVRLLARSAEVSGRRRFGRLLAWAGPPLVILSAATAGWTTFRVLRHYWRNCLDELANIVSKGFSWGWRFTAHQMVAWLITAAVVLGVGWLMLRVDRLAERRRGRDEGRIAASKTRLIVTFTLSVVLLPLMMHGGYEQSRRLGMMGFLLVYEKSANATADRAIQEFSEIAVKSRGEFFENAWPVTDNESGPFASARLSLWDCEFVVLDLSGPTSMPPIHYLKIRFPEQMRADVKAYADRFADKFAPAAGDTFEIVSGGSFPTPGFIWQLPSYPQHTEWSLWGGWQESGDSLDLPPPWHEFRKPGYRHARRAMSPYGR